VSAYEDEEVDYDYDPDDFYDYDRDEPDEPDWGYEEWRAGYEDHCIEAHGGDDCNCRAPLADRIRERFRSARARLRAVLRRSGYNDEPPF